MNGMVKVSDFVYTKHFLKKFTDRILRGRVDEKQAKEELESKFQAGKYTEIPNGYSERFRNETYRGILLLNSKHTTIKYAKKNNRVLFITVWPSKKWELNTYEDERKKI